MTNTTSIVLKRVLFLVGFATVLAAVPANAQEIIYPPAEYIATTTPVYYEGHAAYWYGNHWCYRDGNRWSHYRDEPRFLGDYRAGHREPVRRFYEGRGNARGGHHR